MPFKNLPPLYNAWANMRDRCRNPRFKQWKDYGGRGISVCEEWESYKQFERDMAPKPPGGRLERIDNNKGYSKENCRWATAKEQQRNQRVTRKVTIDGVEYVAADLADRAGIKTDTIVERANQGLTLAEVLSPKRRVFTDGLKLGGRANGARFRARTHCGNGHEYTPENTYLTKQGWRNCRACQREKMRRLRK